jgi:hypothetical protein
MTICGTRLMYMCLLAQDWARLHHECAADRLCRQPMRKAPSLVVQRGYVFCESRYRASMPPACMVTPLSSHQNQCEAGVQYFTGAYRRFFSQPLRLQRRGDHDATTADAWAEDAQFSDIWILNHNQSSPHFQRRSSDGCN